MKKIVIIEIIGLLLFVSYIVLFVLDVSLGLLGDNATLILSVVLALVSIILMLEGFTLKSSSTLWFAICLIIFSIFIIISKLNPNGFISPVAYACIPVLASIINLIIFNYKIYYKLLIINASIIIPVAVDTYLDINVWWKVAVWTGSVLLGIFVCRCIKFKKSGEI